MSISRKFDQRLFGPCTVPIRQSCHFMIIFNLSTFDILFCEAPAYYYGSVHCPVTVILQTAESQTT